VRSISYPTTIEGKSTMKICGIPVAATTKIGPIAKPQNPHPSPNNTEPTNNRLFYDGFSSQLG